MQVTYPLHGSDYFRLSYAERQEYQRLKKKALARQKTLEKPPVKPTQGEVTYPVKFNVWTNLSVAQKKEYAILKAAHFEKLKCERFKARTDAEAEGKPGPWLKLPEKPRDEAHLREMVEAAGRVWKPRCKIQELPAKTRKQVLALMAEMTGATQIEAGFWYDAVMMFIRHELEFERTVDIPLVGQLIPRAKLNYIYHNMYKRGWFVRQKKFAYVVDMGNRKGPLNPKTVHLKKYPAIPKAEYDKWQEEDLA